MTRCAPRIFLEQSAKCCWALIFFPTTKAFCLGVFINQIFSDHLTELIFNKGCSDENSNLCMGIPYNKSLDCEWILGLFYGLSFPTNLNLGGFTLFLQAVVEDNSLTNNDFFFESSYSATLQKSYTLITTLPIPCSRISKSVCLQLIFPITFFRVRFWGWH